MPPSRPALSVVVPAYDEAGRLGATLERLCTHFAHRAREIEILVVDDGSGDATADVAAAALRDWPRGRVLRHSPNRGKGFAVRRGALEATGEWVLLCDADLSTPIEEVERLRADARARGLDVVIGSRALPGSRIEVRQGPLRERLGRTFNVMQRLATGLEFRDTQCGFKLFRLDGARAAFERLSIAGFAFDVELLLLCRQAGLAIGDCPVRWRNDPASRVHIVVGPLTMLHDLLRIAWRACRGRYRRGR